MPWTFPASRRCIELIEPRIRLGPLREAEQEAQENLPLASVDAGRDPQGPDIERAQNREDVTERSVVVELEPEAGGIDENEVARQADLELRLRPPGALRPAASRSSSAFCTVAFSTG